jgi:hypothetical protein
MMSRSPGYPAQSGYECEQDPFGTIWPDRTVTLVDEDDRRPNYGRDAAAGLGWCYRMHLRRGAKGRTRSSRCAVLTTRARARKASQGRYHLRRTYAAYFQLRTLGP